MHCINFKTIIHIYSMILSYYISIDLLLTIVDIIFEWNSYIEIIIILGLAFGKDGKTSQKIVAQNRSRKKLSRRNQSLRLVQKHFHSRRKLIIQNIIRTFTWEFLKIKNHHQIMRLKVVVLCSKSKDKTQTTIIKRNI